jgi:putative two-component system response regulator
MSSCHGWTVLNCVAGSRPTNARKTSRYYSSPAEFGRDAILQAERNLGTTAAGFLSHAYDIAWCHHEKWDGSGYPRGLTGTTIPLSARLMAVADVYDALISRRVYKPPFPHAQAIAMILEGKNQHFDPDIVDALCAIEDKFRAIAADHHDEET